MKKAILLSILTLLIFVPGCDMNEKKKAEEVIQKDPVETQKPSDDINEEDVIEEDENTLVYEVNGEKRTARVKPVEILTGETLLLPSGFMEDYKDEDVQVFALGGNKGLNVRKYPRTYTDSIRSEKFYTQRLLMSSEIETVEMQVEGFDYFLLAFFEREVIINGYNFLDEEVLHYRAGFSIEGLSNEEVEDWKQKFITILKKIKEQ